MKKQNGITLIALVITIIVLLILASVSISMLSGENGILTKATTAKEKTDIGKEKEIVSLSAIDSILENEERIIEKNNLQLALDNNAGAGKTEVIDDEGKLIVKFIESSRFYEVDNNGNISEKYVVIDKNPGDITKDKDGKNLNGTEESPFEIWCIEDLIEWSQNYSVYNNSYIKLCTNLNFKSKLSYTNSESTSYGDINGNGEIEALINEMQSETGFPAIENFTGIFDGNEYKISNLYKYNSGGMFVTNDGTIKNLSLDVDLHIKGGEGGICSANNGKIENVKMYGKIENIGTAAGGSYVGAICYRNLNKIVKTYNYAEIEAISAYVGGICGQNNGTVEKCKNEGNVSASYDVGGIAGINYSIIKECVNKGNITAKNWQAGGIAGRNFYNTNKIENCYNLGNLKASTYVAGIVCDNAGKVNNCYSISEMKGLYQGGIVTSNNEGISNCFYVKNGDYNIQYSGTGTVENSGEKTEDEMKENIILDLLDYGNTEKVWILNSEINDGLPYLSWEE